MKHMINGPSTEKNSFEESLISRFSAYLRLFNNIENGIVIVDKKDDTFSIEYANNIFCSKVGISETEIKSGTLKFVDYIYHTDINKFLHSIHKSEEFSANKATYRIVLESGEVEWQIASYAIPSDDQDDLILIMLTSVQELISIQHELKAANDKWENIINSIPVGLSIFRMDGDKTETLAINDLLVRFSNDVGKKLDGNHRNWSAAELKVILSQNLYAFAEDEDTERVREMLAKAKEEQYSNCNFRLRGSSVNNPIWIRSNTSYSKDENGKDIYYVTYANVTSEVNSVEELRSNHERMKQLSFYDSLTKVHSRNAYNELTEVSRTLGLKNVGFIFADVNGLKNINDTYGHRYGDRMICSFADILRKVFRNDDIYRISGDEFVVILPNIERERFDERVNKLCEMADNENHIAAIGYIWEASVSSLKEPVDKAEQLMYLEKQQYYATNGGRESKRHSENVNILSKELEDGLFMMYLQPKANIDGTKVAGAEALVRKKDRNGKLFFPDTFIPALEREKLIPFLDYFMLEETCKTLQRWKNEGRPLIRISVNMSRVTLAEKNFVEKILEICDRYDVDRSFLEFEITESTETMDGYRLREEVIRLKSEGFTVSLDDMGSDYSALRMLLVDGIDVVKLDRSFILQLDSERGNTLIRYIIEMTHAMGIECVAEGVEDHEQRDKLSRMGCDMYQGYLLSKPVAIEEFEKLM